MNKKLFSIFIISLVVLIVFPGISINEIEGSQEMDKELIFEEPGFPKGLSFPGRIEENGTYFEITDSEYLNISLQSSEEIKIILESIPKMISLEIEVVFDGINSTELIIKGLEPNRTYYKYQDSYKNKAVFVSDNQGNYTWIQALSQPHHVWIQEVRGTVFFPEDCDTYGTWDDFTSTCVLTQDLTESVEITENNITLDCSGHSITGIGTGYGIYLNSKKNIIIRNCTITNFSIGALFVFSSNNTISNNTVLDNRYGILLSSSFSNTLTDNNASNNWTGIVLSPSSNANNLTNNNASNNLGFGIFLQINSDNILTNNTALNNNVGIHFYRSSGNALKNNIMSANTYNFGVSGVNLSDYIQDIDTSNKVNGKPVYYWVGQQNRQVPDDAGYVGIVNSTNITIRDLTLKNNLEGVMLAFSDDSKIENVYVLNNLIGISFFSSSNNTIATNTVTNNVVIGINLTLSSNNTITANTFSSNGNWGIRLDSSSGNVLTNNEVSYSYGLFGGGIYLIHNSDNNVLADNDILDQYLGIRLYGFGENYPDDNKIYHNNFINNLIQAHTLYGGTGNLFDDGYPSGGNYWSDYDMPAEGCIDENNDGFCDAPYTFTDGQDQYPFIEESGWEVPITDFTISEIRPVQVVFDPDINDDGSRIDLVAGKSTMVRVEVAMENYEALDKQELVEVRLKFDGVNYIESRTIEQLEQNNRIEFYPDSPIIIGDQTIIAKVDPENKIGESIETNNENSIEITVKDTNGLYLVYFPVDQACVTTIGFPPICGGYGPIDLAEYSETVSQSGKFIEATYPVAGGEFTNQKSDWKYYGDPIKYLGMIDDAISIWVRGELLTGTLVDISVGIVPDDYFGYHLIGEAKGISLSLPGINGVLTEGGYWTATAHEVGHRFGLRLDEEEYVINPPGNQADGFWVSEHREISNGVCFMGKAGANHSFSHSIKYDNRPIWIDNEDYTVLFKEFRVNKADPDVLLVSGIISKDGTIQLGKSYLVENGTIDYIIPGDYSIQILDADGQVLTDISFYTSFKMYINPFGIIDTDFAGFTLTVPYPENTSKIQIQHNEEILIEINPNSKLLNDAVDLIPDTGFIDNPEQRRKALHNKIEEAEVKIENNEIRDAINKLKFDIKDKFEKWLVDDYQKENPEQLSKAEVIELIQAVIDRLSNQ